MSVECPSCGNRLEWSATECSCGFKKPTRRQAVELHPAQQAPAPRAPHNGRFRSPEELHEYEHEQAGIAEHMRHCIAACKEQLETLPPPRRWAGEVIIRRHHNDPRLTPAALEMATDALKNFPAFLDHFKPAEA